MNYNIKNISVLGFRFTKSKPTPKVKPYEYMHFMKPSPLANGAGLKSLEEGPVKKSNPIKRAYLWAKEKIITYFDKMIEN